MMSSGQSRSYRVVEADNLPDGELMQRSVAHPAMFEQVFERHVRAVGAYVALRVTHPDAEDVVAETFTRAFANRAKFDGHEADARPWLLGIATNLIRRRWRSERRKLAAYGRLNDAIVERARTAEDDVIDQLELQDALRALAQLPRRDRDVLLLHIWAGLTYEEVAGALGIPIGTVRSRIARTRRRLREPSGFIGQYSKEEGLDGR
jgi:RNA polymerase sigma factor (sigma-70 family)